MVHRDGLYVDAVMITSSRDIAHRMSRVRRKCSENAENLDEPVHQMCTTSVIMVILHIGGDLWVKLKKDVMSAINPGIKYRSEEEKTTLVVSDTGLL